MYRKYSWLLLSITTLFTACSSSRKMTGKPITGVKFLSEYIVPSAMRLDTTVIGGLSGIDYDTQRDVYYMICDDPSAFSPARFYTAKIQLRDYKIDTIIFQQVTTIRNPKGDPYPDIRQDRIRSADLEAMRYDPSRDELIRSSEGQRVINDKVTQLQNPDIVIMDRQGNYKDSFELPANMHIQLAEKGPRHNSVFEGLAFNNNYSKVYISVEDAIYEDGPKAGNGDSTAWIRVLELYRNTRKQTAQYGYKVDPVPFPANPAGAFKINGVSDIMYYGKDQLLVVERAWSTGQVASNIRIYMADMRKATNIAATNSLLTDPPAKAISKKLLIDMQSLGFITYNLEGITFGPRLPNGHRSLICVVDDNFSKTEKSQFLLFEILP